MLFVFGIAIILMPPILTMLIVFAPDSYDQKAKVRLVQNKNTKMYVVLAWFKQTKQ